MIKTELKEFCKSKNTRKKHFSILQKLHLFLQKITRNTLDTIRDNRKGKSPYNI